MTQANLLQRMRLSPRSLNFPFAHLAACGFANRSMFLSLRCLNLFRLIQKPIPRNDLAHSVGASFQLAAHIIAQSSIAMMPGNKGNELVDASESFPTADALCAVITSAGTCGASAA